MPSLDVPGKCPSCHTLIKFRVELPPPTVVVTLDPHHARVEGENVRLRALIARAIDVTPHGQLRNDLLDAANGFSKGEENEK